MKAKKITAFKISDIDICRKSQSGGAFFAIANVFLTEPNSVCYGVGFLKDLSVGYCRITSIRDYGKIQKSKYVQAKMGNTYKKVMEDLKAGRKVLFSGLPCQIAGLKEFVDTQKYDGELITVDLICHGGASIRVYLDYLAELRKEGEIKDFEFRTKDLEWGEHQEKITYSDGKMIYAEKLKHMFCSHLIMRPSCYSCRFSSLDRLGDFTVGDFWGVRKWHPEFYSRNGVSVILFNTDTAQRYRDKILEQGSWIFLKQREIFQPNLQIPTPASKVARKHFWKEYGRHGVAGNFEKAYRLQSVYAEIYDYIYRAQRVFGKYFLRTSPWR